MWDVALPRLASLLLYDVYEKEEKYQRREGGDLTPILASPYVLLMFKLVGVTTDVLSTKRLL